MTDVFPPDDDSELVIVRRVVAEPAEQEKPVTASASRAGDDADDGSDAAGRVAEGAFIDLDTDLDSEPDRDLDTDLVTEPDRNLETAHNDLDTGLGDGLAPGDPVVRVVSDSPVRSSADDAAAKQAAAAAAGKEAVKTATEKAGTGKAATGKAATGKGRGADEAAGTKLVKVVSISHDEDLDGPLPVQLGTDDGPIDSNSRPAVSVDPRLRERRREVDRLITRKRLFVGIGIFTVLLLVVGTLAVFASTIFDVKTITVYGNVFTTDDQLAPVLAELRGKPILTVDINKARTQLEAMPFVKQADIATDFPHTVHIEIEERQPALSYIGTDGQWRIIDDDGRVLTLLGGQPADYKPINGVGPAIDAGGYAGAGYGAAATIARSLPNELQPYMASFNVKNTGDIDLVLITGTVISFGQPTDMTAKLAAVLTKFRSTPPSKVAAIDVTNPAAIGVTLK